VTQENIEEMLEKPYWIVDIIPERVPKDSPGRYFAIEQYFLEESRILELRRKQLGMLLRLNCYCGFTVSFDAGLHWVMNPAPEEMERRLLQKERVGDIHIMVDGGKSMIALNLDDTYMTVYDPTERILELLQSLASAEGLFTWKPPAD
jgi:hypothetical protein